MEGKLTYCQLSVIFLYTLLVKVTNNNLETLTKFKDETLEKLKFIVGYFKSIQVNKANSF